MAALFVQIYFEICFLKSFLDTTCNSTLERRVNSIEQIIFREVCTLRDTEIQSESSPFSATEAESENPFGGGTEKRQKTENDILSQREGDQKRRAIINLKFRNKVNYQAFL